MLTISRRDLNEYYFFRRLNAVFPINNLRCIHSKRILNFFLIIFQACLLRGSEYYIDCIQVDGFRIVKSRVNVNSPETRIGVYQIVVRSFEQLCFMYRRIRWAYMVI